VEFDRTGRALERYARQTDRILRQISGIPIVGLSDATKPADERFGGLETFNDTTTTVRLLYGDARAGGPWASVHTSRWIVDRIGSGPLRSMVERDMRLCGDRFSAVEWTEGDATVVVDGQPVAGRIVRAGERWWAARCERGDIEITIVSRDWHPDTIEVDKIVDPVPMLSRLASPPRPQPRPEPEPLPEDARGEPHRALVNEALSNARLHAEWLADGGPLPQFPQYWSTLWRATVERQMDLTGQPEPEARRAVGAIVNQLTALDDRAAWFREHGPLRERAIAETLLYWTGLHDRVASLPAQQAWLRREVSGPDEDRAAVESRVAADRQWIDAWTAWARDR
jgi:hypothetical protein